MGIIMSISSALIPRGWIMRLLDIVFIGAVAIGCSSGSVSSGNASTPIKAIPIATGLTNPVFVTAPLGDTSRVFIIEKPGRIVIVENGTQLGTPFLDISSAVNSGGSEQGLLGMAFAPEFDSSGYFYVNYTGEPDASTVIARAHAAPGSNVADPTVETLLVVPQPYSNHNGGMLAFSPKDSMLYIGLGDGGSGGDPENRAQNLDSLLGKILRVDVRTAPGYQIPADNPFAGVPADSARPEIWAWGLRNPWRFSFDRETGDLWIADVGQGQIEEIDWQQAGAMDAKNYGWRLKEGNNCYIPNTGCDTLVGLTSPIVSYPHTSGRCSITGGYVYRGCAMPDLVGAYFYGDFCTGEIISIRYNGTVVFDSVSRTAALTGAVGSFDLSSFGEDGRGEIYICGHGSGRVSKIVPNGVPSACDGSMACCAGSVGNIDASPDQNVDISDLSGLIDYLYISFIPLACTAEANCDGSPDGNIDIADLSSLIDFLYISFIPLPLCP